MSRLGVQFAKELHRRVVKKFPRRQVLVNDKNVTWGLDLADMSNLSEDNDDVKFLLVIVDNFSRFAFVIPLKDKKAESIVSAVNYIVENFKIKPIYFWVDKGTEFYNKKLEKWLKDHNIKIYSTYGESKSVIAERFIRTLKQKIYFYLTSHHIDRYIDVLQNLVNEYNNTIHRSIKMKPIDAMKDINRNKVIHNLYSKTKFHDDRKNKLKINDYVRISRTKSRFEKEHHYNFSVEIFQVADVLDTYPVTYQIKDMKGDIIVGSFYQQELQKVKEPIYIIEKVLRTRKKDGRTERLIKYFGHETTQWVPE